ncbi:MAG: sodium:proton antiporter [Burkholderiales bacterium]|jgi:CPA1 family monovalent cation:H+ antiporter
MAQKHLRAEADRRERVGRATIRASFGTDPKASNPKKPPTRNMLNIAIICLVITALLAYLNHRFVGLPMTIGVMAVALVFSLGLVGLDAIGVAHSVRAYEESLLHSIDFPDLLMHGMLSLMLFAGALHVDLSELKAFRWQVATLAGIATTLSSFAVGFGMWLALPVADLQLPLMYCLLFGALISPTDPIAVMGILKSARAPKELELLISSEALFNDGVAVVIFSLLLGMLTSGVAPSPGQTFALLANETGGGLLFGMCLGYLTFHLLKTVDNYQVEVLLTLAAVTGGYALASKLEVSGPLSMVVAGLIIGNHGRSRAMSDTSRRYLDMFWELVDEILNAMLFVLIGMEVLLITFSVNELLATALAITVTLLARLLTVGLPARLLGRVVNLPKGSWKVLTWGSLRGGISVALALSLPPGVHRDTVVTLTYGVVVFSILAQGLSFGYVARKAASR